MHVLFLTDNFPPEVNAPASRTFEHCREWVKEGHEVTVITCVPNFPRGKVFPGYRNRLWQQERMDGIRVVRLWSYMTPNEGFLKRTLDYMSYMVAAILASPFVRKADVVVGTSPHIFTAIAAYVVGVLKGIPFVFELRDLWPEQIRAVGALKNVPGLRVVEKPVLRLLERLELFLYRKASLIVAVTSAFKKNLTDRGIDVSKILVISNGIDLSRYGPQPKDEELTRMLGLDGKFVTGYMGTHGMSQGLDTVLDAAKIMADRADGNRYTFLMIGDGAEKARLVGRCRALGLRNTLFLDTVPKKEVVRYWSLFDACIVHLRRDPLFTTVIPSKLFEIMGMGIPLIHAVPGESSELVQKERVGVVIPPEDPAAMADAVVRLAVDSNLRQSFKERAAKVAPRYDRAEMAGLMMRELLALSVPDKSRQSPLFSKKRK